MQTLKIMTMKMCTYNILVKENEGVMENVIIPMVTHAKSNFAIMNKIIIVLTC